MSRAVIRTAADVDAMEGLGRRLATALRAGDLVVLAGDLGAGKTVLARGIGAGLGVRGPVTSPTFVIAREHPSLSGGPAMVHVDAYRLGGPGDVEGLDLDASLDDAVTVVEWGRGRVEELSADRLEIDIEERADEVRRVAITAVGPRWEPVDLAALLDG